MAGYTALAAPKIFTGTAWAFEKVILINEGIIKDIVSRSEVPSHYSVRQYEGFIAPAFIDVQIYGAAEKLFSVYPEPSSLHLLQQHCLKGGTVLHLPTVATNSLAVFKQCIDAVRAYWQQGGQGVHGLHLEGPWINVAKRGAHITEYIHAPTQAEVDDLLTYGDGVIKMITLAPEVCAPHIIRHIQSAGIIVSAGHSNATYEEAMQAFDAGISTATHLFNAMSALQHRAPGMVGALFNHSSAKCSIIPDGHHVDYAAIKIAKKQMGERLFVITDAVTATNQAPYYHQLEGDKYVSNGILSGSALSMHQAFANLVQHVAIEVEEALRMCSRYPAEMLGNIGYGKIAPQHAAQFVVIGNDVELIETISAA